MIHILSVFADVLLIDKLSYPRNLSLITLPIPISLSLLFFGTDSVGFNRRRKTNGKNKQTNKQTKTAKKKRELCQPQSGDKWVLCRLRITLQILQMQPSRLRRREQRKEQPRKRTNSTNRQRSTSYGKPSTRKSRYAIWHMLNVRLRLPKF